MAAQVPAPQTDKKRLRMKDLCELTGMPRQAIHFYIRQGLVPPGEKTGKNMAYYGEEHVERLRLVRQLQHEQFLPLKAIRAVLDNQGHSFTAAQREFLVQLRERIAPASQPTPRQFVPARDLAASFDVDVSELAAMAELGLMSSRLSESGELELPMDEAWMVETIATLRSQGFTDDLGFTVPDLALYADAISMLFHREADMLFRRLSHLSPAQVARMVSGALPAIHSFLVKYHETLVRHLVGGDLTALRGMSP